MQQIDDSLYSRQMYVLGKDAMEKLTQSAVLLIGLDGLGTEIAKNIVLAGIRKLFIFDNNVICQSDLSSGFYFSECDIGRLRTTVVFDKLRELNPYVEINVVQCIEDIYNTIDLVQTVVFANHHNISEIMEINEKIRPYKKTIVSSTNGLFGTVFCDFGNEFTVVDTDGEAAKSGQISSISHIDDFIMFDTPNEHGVCFNDTISISYNSKTIETKVKKIATAHKFGICYDPQFVDVLSVGFVVEMSYVQHKFNEVVKFKSFRDILNGTKFLSSFNAYDEKHAQKCHEIYTKYLSRTLITSDDEQYDTQDEMTKLFVSGCGGKLCFVNSIIGSIASQEVMKSLTGKFMPIRQMLYYEELKLTNLEILNVTTNSRYFGNELVFGSDFQKVLNESKIFIVGAGAIGCEHLKNFAMLGVENIVITDMDTIEKSNLNRQFLFRNSDIGKFKSDSAASAIRRMNPRLNVVSHTNKVGKETEHVYDRTFFSEISCVTNALDNVSARLFVDTLCLKYGKPLLESGTLGSKGNVQVIVPFLTESYGSMQDPVESSVPVCTLKNFPYEPSHTIQYARDMFEGLFSNIPEKMNSYLTNKDRYLDSLTITQLDEFCKEIHSLKTPRHFDDCIDYAVDFWYDHFHNQIVKLINQYPANHVDNDVVFWSGTRRFPSYRQIDINNKTDIEFIQTYANLYAKMFSIKSKSMSLFDLKAVQNRSWDITKTVSDVKIDGNETEQQKMESRDRHDIYDEIRMHFNVRTPLQIAMFEKDDDSNGHIDFIHCYSSLRNENYRIDAIDRMQTKKIAGKIIPAIATTTSLVSGLVVVEFIKILKKYSKLDEFKNYFVNLALPLFTYSDPIQMPVTSSGDIKFSIWDNLYFDDMTIGQFIDHFRQKYNVVVTMISNENKLLYSTVWSGQRQLEKKNNLISRVYLECYGESVSHNREISLFVTGDKCCDTNVEDSDSDSDDDEMVEFPTCTVRIK